MIEKKALKRIERISSTNSFILGKELNEFELSFADYNNAKFCIGVGNGTDSLELILRALNIPKESEVLLPANTFIATVIAVIRAGFTPVLVDINSISLLSEAENYSAKITKKSKVLIVVSLFGNYPKMEEIKTLADKNKLIIVEDAAQAQGSSYHLNKMGFYSEAASTSFYPGKNLGAWGDGGAVITNNSEIASMVQYLRNYGSREKYNHEHFGINSRLDHVQAAVLSEKLKFLDKLNEMRAELSNTYFNLLSTIPEIKFVRAHSKSSPNYHLFVIRAKKRDALKRFLQDQGIESMIHYPKMIYDHIGLKGLIPQIQKNGFKVSEKAKKEILSLPLYPGMPTKYVKIASEAIKSFYDALK